MRFAKRSASQRDRSAANDAGEGWRLTRKYARCRRLKERNMKERRPNCRPPRQAAECFLLGGALRRFPH